MTILLRSICLAALCGLALSATHALAADPMPDLQALLAKDIPPGCGCAFGEKKGTLLIFWSWENDKQYAVIRDAAGAHRLQLRSEKYFPAQHEPPLAGDRMTLQLAMADWNIQTVSEVTRACSPKARQCSGTDYRSHLILQWQARQHKEISGWGNCGCP